MRMAGAPWSAVDDGHVAFVVPLARGRGEVVQQDSGNFDIFSAELDGRAFEGFTLRLVTTGMGLGPFSLQRIATVSSYETEV
jgi:hypothetical protein